MGSRVMGFGFKVVGLGFGVLKPRSLCFGVLRVSMLFIGPEKST